MSGEEVVGNFEGHPDRECGDHHTLGKRAWCHDCSEYCYPGTGGCRGCEIPGLREKATRVDNGWVPFGWHLAYPSVRLEFDGTDECGNPVWERNANWGRNAALGRTDHSVGCDGEACECEWCGGTPPALSFTEQEADRNASGVCVCGHTEEWHSAAGWCLSHEDQIIRCSPPDAEPLGQCDACGRKTWSEQEIGHACAFPQPDGTRCDGWFDAATAADRNARGES